MGEYWIIYPDDRSVQIFKLTGDRFEPAGYRREGQSLATGLLPGFELPVSKLFE